jgi:hypothetical protein
MHAGVVPVQAVRFPVVHVTHWFVAVLHAGVPPLHVVSPVHGSHLPAFVPLVTQTDALHCAVVAHVPSPTLTPQTLAAVSHAPLEQTMAATVGEQLPVSGGEWFATLGSAAPFARVAAHVFAGVLQ